MSDARRGKFSWRTRAEKPLNLWVFASVHPAILLAEFSITNDQSLQVQLVELAFTWYGLLFSLGLFLALRWALERMGLIRRGYWAVLIAFGAFIGVTADVSTALFEGISPAQVLDGIPENHWFAILLGGLLAIASASFETAREDYNATRNMIIAERVRKASVVTPAKSQILLSFIEGAKKRLRQGAAGEVATFTQELREFINDELRPLSHSLWEKEEKQQRFFSSRFIVFRVLSRPIRYPAVVAGFGALAGLRSAITRDLAVAPFHIAAVFAAITGSLYLARFVYRRFDLPSWIRSGYLVLSAVVAGLVVTIVSPLFSSFDPRTVIFNYWILATLVVLIGGMVTTLIAEIRQLLADQARDLREVLKAGDLSDENARLLASIRARDAANYLHSTTQNRLLALALRLEGKKVDFEKLDDEDLAELDDILEDALKTQRPVESLAEGLGQLSQSWDGLMNLRIELSKDVNLTEIEEELAFLAIREAVSNSYRHGNAKNVQITITPVSQGEEIVILDDGIGPRGGGEGLGSKIFNLCGRWSMREGAAGGSEVRIVL